MSKVLLKIHLMLIIYSVLSRAHITLYERCLFALDPYEQDLNDSTYPIRRETMHRSQG